MLTQIAAVFYRLLPRKQSGVTTFVARLTSIGASIPILLGDGSVAVGDLSVVRPQNNWPRDFQRLWTFSTTHSRMSSASLMPFDFAISLTTSASSDER